MPDVTLTIPDHLHIGDMTAGIFARLLTQERAAAAESANTEANTLRAQLTAAESIVSSIRDALNLGEGDHPLSALQALVTERDNLKAELDKALAERDMARTDTNIANGAYDGFNSTKAM